MRKLINFFQKDIWQPQDSHSPVKNFVYKWIRIWYSSIKEFLMDDEGFEKASTLTFYSLLSIIPVVAIGFGIAQKLGFAEKFTEQIKAQFPGQPQVADKIIEFSLSTLKQTEGSVIAAFGLAVLLWTVFRMVANIATYFNKFWKVETARTFWQQVKTFVPMIILFPLFLVGSNSLIIYLSTKAVLATQSIEILHFVGPAVTFLFNIIPYLVSWLLLSFFYIYLPNTKVFWKAGVIAGIITGIFYQIWQWIYVTFQVNAASYGAIYGSFAAVPLFLIWLNYSWVLILFGTELSYHIQQEEKGIITTPTKEEAK